MDIENEGHKPSIEELSAYVSNCIFDELNEHMSKEYAALTDIEYSRDSVLLGWNIRYKKAGRTLCRVYPRKEYFGILLVVGQKEKPIVEEALPSMSPEFVKLYTDTQEGMGQRWMVTYICEHNALYDDLLKVIRFRRSVK